MKSPTPADKWDLVHMDSSQLAKPSQEREGILEIIDDPCPWKRLQREFGIRSIELEAVYGIKPQELLLGSDDEWT